MSLPAFESTEPHWFADSADGCTTTGWPCPMCDWLSARVLYLEPPNGARVVCLGMVVNQDWGTRGPCAHEFSIRF